ncbi:MAG: hypothetical protein OXF26_04160 [Alphaproteobacteria bacterium]|nr:hypothetical protein [Alphaproteobacteria bacterium]MCY4318494.1 hypothetical protein [Alphaproteobacteria bacterium]
MTSTDVRMPARRSLLGRQPAAQVGVMLVPDQFLDVVGVLDAGLSKMRTCSRVATTVRVRRTWVCGTL